MSLVNAEIKMQGNDNAFFTTNAAVVYPANIQIFHTDGRYKFTDGVTDLQTLPFLGGNSTTPNLQQVTDEGNSTTKDLITTGAVKIDLSGFYAANIDSNGINVLDSALNNPLFEVDRITDSIKKLGVEVATVNDMPSLAGYEVTSNKQTDLTASATKYPTVNAVNTGLATKVPLNTLSNIFGSCTVVGWSSYTTSVVDVIDLGNIYMINGHIEGISDNATTTVQLPFSNNGSGWIADMTFAKNNGSNITGRWYITGGSDTIVFNTSAAGASYTASGTKTVFFSLAIPK